jgi:glycosyltransferase involved in cell wall biosynthesis
MTVIGVAMVKDEADIIVATVCNMVRQVDQVIVADNGSTDGTWEILQQLEDKLGNLTVLEDLEPAYLQSKKMTGLACLAGGMGATWVVPFDADEWWYSNTGTIRDVLNQVGDLSCVDAQLWDHVATGFDSPDVEPVTGMEWRRAAPLPLPKVVCRYRPNLTIHQGNHGCDYDGIVPRSALLLNVRHFPYRSVDQFIRKVRNGAAAYRAAGDRLPETAGAHWRQWGAILDGQGEDAVAQIFRTWYWRDNPTQPIEIGGELQPPLIHDPVPR